MQQSMTSIAELFSIELPLIQAPMGGVQGAGLAAAVCEAGGLGSLPAAMMTTEEVRAGVAEIRGRGRAAFNLNFFAHQVPQPDPAIEQRWLATLRPFYEELGADSQSLAIAPGREPFGEQSMQLIEELRPPVVSFHYGLPSAGFVDRIRQTGARLISSATTVEEARWLEQRGVDALIAQGSEAGGHRGMFLTADPQSQIGLMSLLPQIAAAVGVPVIAAGGIADARGVAAAMDLGAAGVQVGTAYLLCPEATTSALHRQAIRSEAAGQTVLTNIFTGRLARAIPNRFVRELGPLRDDVPPFPRAASAFLPLRLAAEQKGSPDFSLHLAGQSAPLCREIGAAQMTRELMAAVRLPARVPDAAGPAPAR